MRIDLLTIFPEYFEGPKSNGVVRIAEEKDLLRLKITDIRDFTDDERRTVDDAPFGGGAGMVMKPEPVARALDSVDWSGRRQRIVMLTPRGRVFDQDYANDLAGEDQIALVCGHYEGIDERVYEMATEELSLGDFVLSGGEAAAVAVVDAITRLIPGVLGGEESLAEESFKNGLLEYPHYTRPQVFRDKAVPDVLLSGNHGKIAGWRRRESVLATARRRPDMIAKAALTDEEKAEAERIIGLDDA
jgi:tRNA (guanine37-N1)-methyltransferase